MLVVEIGSQQKLFGEPSILDDDGFLSDASIVQIKEIARALRGKNKSLEDITGVPLPSWNNWLYRKRPPSGPALAFLKLFLIEPDKALKTLEKVGKSNDVKLMQ